MLVAYNKPNAWSIYTRTKQEIVDGNTAKKIAIDDSAIGEVGVPAFKFIPGINEISTTVWDSIKEHHKVKRFLKERVLEVEFDKDPGENQVAISVVKDADQAVRIVKRTYNLKTLEIWKSADSRGQVTSACIDQIAMIKERTEKPKGDDDE